MRKALRLVQYCVILSLYLLDVATDWNLFRSMNDSYDEFKDSFEEVRQFNTTELECTCACSSQDPCSSTLSNSTLCDAFSLNAGGSSCDIRAAVSLLDRSGGQCDYEFDFDEVSGLIDELGNLRWASLAINIIITPLVLYYLIWLARNSALRAEAEVSNSPTSDPQSKEDSHQLETIQQQQLQQHQQMQTRPSFDDSTDTTLQPAPNVENACFNCNYALHPKARFCPNCGAKQMEFNKDTMQGKQMRLWLKRFLGMMHLRMVFILFEDLPQILILIRYIVVLDANTGLVCRNCVARGGTCTFEDITKRGTLIVSLLGTIGSVLVFLLQMTLAELRTYRLRKQSKETGRVHLCGVTGVFAASFVVSLVITPALFMVGSTSARDILDFSDTEIAVVFIVACLAALPLLIFIVMFLLFVCEECGYDSTNIGFNCQEDMCCVCDGDSCCECEDGCCCCDCC